MVLNWTGLKDTYGVPIGNYYLAIATVRDQITQAGPGVDWNPVTLDAVDPARHGVDGRSASPRPTSSPPRPGSSSGSIALALWLMKITVSTYWLTVIGEIARALAGAVIQVTTAAGPAADRHPDRRVRRRCHHPSRRSRPRLDDDPDRADHAGAVHRDVRRSGRPDVWARRRCWRSPVVSGSRSHRPPHRGTSARSPAWTTTGKSTR